jgi:hypothetical protein
MALMVKIYRCSKKQFDGFVGFHFCVVIETMQATGWCLLLPRRWPKSLCAAKFGSAMLALAIYGSDSLFGFFWTSFDFCRLLIRQG